MALNSANTANDITTALEGIMGHSFDGTTRPQVIQYWTAVINALYTRIKADMIVSSSVAVASVTGVTSGASSSGPGTGTATSSTIT